MPPVSDAPPTSRPASRLRFGRLARRVRGAVTAPISGLVSRLSPQPTRLVIVPPDLRTLDPSIARDILAGHYAFGGKVIVADDSSPFAIAGAAEVWLRGLYGFAWLRHMTALQDIDARARARAIVSEFLALKALPREADDPRVVARRLIALISAAPWLLDGADADFYRNFLRALCRHGRRLQRAAISEYEPLVRLQAGAALLHLALSTDRSESLARRAIATVSRELNAQIAADGGHIGRNPETCVGLLLDLIPLRQCFVRRGVEPPADILNAIDRMLAMVRHLRHADGALAAFNGAGGTPRDLMATLIAYGDAASAASAGLRGGYARLVAGGSVALIDAASAGPIAATSRSHAGCLALEFSGDGRRWIVNCGAPRDEGTELAEAVRTTIAHSTATIGNSASAQFIDSSAGTFLAGPPGMRAHLSDDGQSFNGAHDGYVSRFGVIHERTVKLTADGGRLSGRDVFAGDVGDDGAHVVLRFHIHPSVDAQLADDDSYVLLVGRDAVAWRFQTEDVSLDIEDSIFLGDGAPRRTMQITLRIDLVDRRHVAWSIERVSRGRARGEDAR
ncbi:MAG: heparinase II/III family protein [Beijerinckiaceae bacterium]